MPISKQKTIVLRLYSLTVELARPRGEVAWTPYFDAENDQILGNGATHGSNKPSTLDIEDWLSGANQFKLKRLSYAGLGLVMKDLYFQI